MKADVLTILDCPDFERAHTFGVGSGGARRIYDLLSTGTGDRTMPNPNSMSLTQCLITVLNKLLDMDADQTILTSRLLEEVNKIYEKTAQLHDRLMNSDGRHVQLRRLNSQIRKVTKKLAHESKMRGTEAAVINLRFSLSERDIPQSTIEKMALALVNACMTAGAPLRRIDWVRMEEREPGERFSSIVDMVSTRRIPNRARERFRRVVRTVITNNKKAATRTNKRPRSTEPSPAMSKRQVLESSFTHIGKSSPRAIPERETDV